MRDTPSEPIDYIRKTFAPEDTLLKNIVQRIHDHVRPIQIGAEEGKLLSFLIQLGKINTIVEIGTLLGYSTIWMARALPKAGHIYTLEHDPDCRRMAKESFEQSEVSHKITLIEGMANETLPKLANKGPFDMIFIDADKCNYHTYLDWAEHNIKKGGLIIGDNTFLFGAVYQAFGDVKGVRKSTYKTICEFNQRLADPARYNSIMLPTEQGITIAQKLF